MRIRVSGLSGRLLSRAFIGVALMAGVSGTAAAQTTVTLSQPSDVVFATIRGGSYANDNEPDALVTRAASNLEYQRRALLKFDTHNGIPAGSNVTSALLTVTVKVASQDASRNVGVYQVTTSFAETEVTWNRRRVATEWSRNGGDLGTRLDTASAGAVKGSKITFDVTALVKMAVAGKLGTSRYTRIALVDLDGSTADSYREYYTPKDTNTAVRPVLKVTYGGSTSTPTPTTTRRRRRAQRCASSTGTRIMAASAATACTIRIVWSRRPRASILMSCRSTRSRPTAPISRRCSRRS